MPSLTAGIAAATSGPTRNRTPKPVMNRDWQTANTKTFRLSRVVAMAGVWSVAVLETSRCGCPDSGISGFGRPPWAGFSRARRNPRNSL
jgi:hypothetical protein